MNNPINFALFGASGYVAPRHMKAIKATGNNLVAALDPYDNCGVLDSYFLDCAFFTQFERFDRFLDKCRRDGNPIEWVSIATPNHLHDAHIRYALRNGCNVICEKPLVIMPHNLDGLLELEQETGKRVFTVMQLREHERIKELKWSVDETLKRNPSHIFDVQLEYTTVRGPWFFHSWKGNENLSGGLAANIGIHFLDVLAWIFGKEQHTELHHKESDLMSGFTAFTNAGVTWNLSTSPEMLAIHGLAGDVRAYRRLTVDGANIDFSDGFNNLHTVVYEKALSGEGVGISAARNSIDLAHKIRGMGVERKGCGCGKCG
jgi:UDP-N-acetyl-2-amino-2-deoxyglucuronate dehydrogenase